MSIAESREGLHLPESLRGQLDDFRRGVWTVKTLESLCAAAFGVVAAYLAMYALDRLWDTPGWPRVALFAVVAMASALVPLALYRWVWRHRKPEQLARLLARKQPRIGDQLLGVIELVQDASEQRRSRQLCEAAVLQVAEEARSRDFRSAVPNPRHKQWATIFAAPAAVAIGLFAAYPSAAKNAWARLLAPWKATPRYTFAAVHPLPGRLVVPHGETFPVTPRLAPGSAWTPDRAEARIGEQPLVIAPFRDDGYTLAMPAQVGKGMMDLRIGDYVQTVAIEPIFRPELLSLVADVTLPDYLGRKGVARKDVRGGSIALVKGARAAFAATAGRALARAWVDGKPAVVKDATVTSGAIPVDASRNVEIRWEDAFGLAGKEPFVLKITGKDDEAPSLSVEDLPRQKVVLDSELLNFKVHAQDDFGVLAVGLEWQGLDSQSVKSPAAGEKILAAGGFDREAMEVAGTFSAKTLGIEPQPVAVRVFVTDAFPGRARVYSPPSTLFVLSPEQHAIWLTEMLSKWHRQALEVRDREMQLYEGNKALRALSPEELDRPDARKKIEAQSNAEKVNGRRLSGLVMSGEDLVKQAMRNPEFGVGHLERWAEMLQILKDISGNRMPSVADLLKQAADAPKALANAPSNNAPAAGNDRSGAGGKSSKASNAPPKPPTNVPAVVDRESSQQPADKTEEPPAPPSGPKTPRLLLPKTEIAGGVKPGKPGDPPAAPKLDEAITQQRDLLAEFEKVADELNRVLANLEGSTLVKRLKAASRTQANVAGRLGDQVSEAFGVARAGRTDPAPGKLADLSDIEAKGSQVVSVIMDDLQSYFERRQYARFKAVLDEMRQKDVIGALRALGDDLKAEHGLSIAQCEFWSDTLDRWADDLVDPASSGTCPGSKSKGSLPPSLVLEVLQILESEVNLREETRVAQQARPALAEKEFARQARGLSTTQEGLKDRVAKVIERIRDLPDSEAEFGQEMALLGQVEEVMDEASGILAKPETGPPAIAAETEAIELLLQSKRINPKAGGGGGSSPGGGGRGTTQDSAMALLGNGVNQKEVREDRGISQATGDSGAALPEEFRAGLDQYFNKLDRGPAGR